MEIEYEKSNNKFAFAGTHFLSEQMFWRENLENRLYYRKSKLSIGVLHWHEHIEVCRLIKGSAQFTVEGHKYDFNVGDIIIIPSKRLHLLECSDEHLAEVFVIPTFYFSPVLNEYPTHRCHILSDRIDEIDGLKDELDALFNKIETEFLNKENHWDSIALTCALNIFCLLSRNFNIFNTNRRKNSQIIEPVLAEIKTDSTNHEYSLSYFAKKLGYTTEYFSYIFKEYTGKGFKMFLDRQRIEEAKRIMLARDVSITDLAIMCGYNNVRTFNNQFKKFEKITPTDFQKQIVVKSNTTDEII